MAEVEEHTLSDENLWQKEAWLDSIMNAKSPPSKMVLINKIPRDTKDYTKYFVPKVVSIGPYHHDMFHLKPVESLKPVFTNKLLSEKTKLRELYDNLLKDEMVQELKDFYERSYTNYMSVEQFVRMMLLDGCFIVYYIKTMSSDWKKEDFAGLKSHQIRSVSQDLFLLENQIPFKVLGEVMNSVEGQPSLAMINDFITIFLESLRPKRGMFFSKTPWAIYSHPKGLESCIKLDDSSFGKTLLQHLHHRYTGTNRLKEILFSGKFTFRNVNELLDVGINFRPSKSASLAHVNFDKGWFSSNLELPPITVDDFILTMLLNLLEYEKWQTTDSIKDVTSYVCFLDSLIDHPEDVKVLRQARVLHSQWSDQEVANLFNQIGFDLLPEYSMSYLFVMEEIQGHYDSKKNKWIGQLKNEYMKSPWSFIALVGGVMALFLSGVQAYFTIWGMPGECDHLCMYLKMNHHL